MNMRNIVKRILSEIKENNKIKEIILNANDIDDFIKALQIQYGDTIPLYHATTLENSKLIDEYGFKLVGGKNYLSFSDEPFIYFQIGKSDYLSDERPVLYRLDVPLSFIMDYGYADMDNIDISDEELIDYGVDVDDLNTDILDMIRYFVWNDFKLDGFELLISNRDGENTDIFKNLTPIKLN